MSPPIRDGSGNDIGAIRLGDGSEISEVRTGAGDVLFSANVIPDSGLLREYDWRKVSGTSTVEDQTGSGDDLTGAYNGPTGTINGVQAGDFDTAQNLDVTYSTTFTQPIETFTVFQADSIDTSEFNIVVDDDDDFVHQAAIDGPEDQWAIYVGSTLGTGNADTNSVLFVSRLDSTSSEININNGASSNTGNAGTTDISGMTVGTRYDGEDEFDGRVGYISQYDPTVSGYNRQDVIDALVTIWGPF